MKGVRDLGNKNHSDNLRADMPLISYIIPVYNTEKYLHECVDSVINCNEKINYEILLINDGSTDGSYGIMEELAQKYDNIRIFTKENGGASSARNCGLSEANGKYVSFIDSDDYLICKDFSLVASILSKDNYDCVILSLLRNNKKRKKVRTIVYGEEDIIRLVATTDLFSGPCAKFYKRNIIEKNKISFSERMRIGEDTNFNIKFMEYARNAYQLDMNFYFYRSNPQSLTSNFNFDIFENSEINYYARKELLHKKNVYDKYNKKLKMMHLNSFFFSFLRIYKVGLPNPEKTIISYMDSEYYNELIKDLRLRDIKNKYAIIYVILKLRLLCLMRMIVKLKLI
jgi:glycosyltransferase involved in cell wall biosynthesis